MKKIALIMIAILLQNCKSQSNFDLINIELHKDKIGDIIPKGVVYWTYGERNLKEGGMQSFPVKQGKAIKDLEGVGPYYNTTVFLEDLLVFNGLKLSGRRYPEQNYKRNGVNFRYARKDSTIVAYTISVYTDYLSVKLMENLGVINLMRKI